MNSALKWLAVLMVLLALLSVGIVTIGNILIKPPSDVFAPDLRGVGFEPELAQKIWPGCDKYGAIDFEPYSQYKVNETTVTVLRNFRWGKGPVALGNGYECVAIVTDNPNGAFLYYQGVIDKLIEVGDFLGGGYDYGYTTCVYLYKVKSSEFFWHPIWAYSSKDHNWGSQNKAPRSMPTTATDLPRDKEATIPAEFANLAAEGELELEPELLTLWPDLEPSTTMLAVPYKNSGDQADRMAIFRAVRMGNKWPMVKDGFECVMIFSKTNRGTFTVDGKPVGNYVGSLMGKRSGIHFFIVESSLLSDPSKVKAVPIRQTY